MKIITLDHPIDDRQRGQLLFEGHLLIYRQRSSMLELIDYTKSMLKIELADLEPTSAQRHLNTEQFLQATGAAQTRFRTDPKARQLFFQVLRECGVKTHSCYYDHFPLRVVPFCSSHTGAHRAAIAHHRDTWGSNIHSQQNWWAPIYTLSSERTIAIYPAYWHQAIANTTESWSFEEFLAARAKSEIERQVPYPSAPSPIQTVDESDVVKLVIEPGDVLNFASAQLHASVPNTTDATRYSVEMRTVHLSDLNANRQAPNIDNAASEPMYFWFKNIESKQKLSHLS